MKHGEQERKNNETWWKMGKNGNMMKNRGKNNETWWTREKKTRKNDEKEWKKQWNIMKKKKKLGNMMKNRETTMKNNEK